MNRYPIWKYIAMLISLVLGLLYTLPNFFGEAPAVQVSSGKATVKVDTAMMGRVESVLRKAGIEPTGLFFDGNSVKVRVRDNDTQLKAKDALVADLNPDAADPSYIVALNLLSSSPEWLTSMRALPMYLGLDLRGGSIRVLESVSGQDADHLGSLRDDAVAARVRGQHLGDDALGLVADFIGLDDGASGGVNDRQLRRVFIGDKDPGDIYGDSWGEFQGARNGFKAFTVRDDYFQNAD